MAKKSDIPDPIPGGPVPAREHQALGDEPAAPSPTHRRRIRMIALAIGAALVIAGGSATLTAFALAPAGPTMSGMPGTANSPAAAPSAAPSVDTAGFPTGGPGIFTDSCLRTKTAPNDPILMPGMTGASMQHDFFGNTATTASTTTAELLGGATGCTTSADASAYWTPVLFQNGTALTPKSTLIYWRAPAGAQREVQTVPAGLTMIAGDESASAPQGKEVIGWSCTGVGQLRMTDSPRDCDGGARLRLVIAFPNCWDGHTLDGAKQTNVVAMSGGSCPASHPVQIPQIVLHVVYPTSSASGLTLSIGPSTQGSVDTAHADFMNGWNQAVLTADVNACVVTGTRCGPVSGAEATPRGGMKR